jgi:aryl-alcohol dehydrogenase-like predicted oxidoreductase
MWEETVKEDTGLTRRDFLRVTAVAGVAGALGPAARAAEGDAEEAPMPRRTLGRTKLEVSLFGLGCYYLGRMKSNEEADRVLRRVLHHGVNYFDTAPSYGKGLSEGRIGKAVKGRRDRVVIASKSFLAEGSRVLEELEGSLKRLGTGHVDLFQMHSVRNRDDLERRFAPGGAIEGFVKAKKQGKARHIGLTGHADPEVVNEALDRFAFDTVLVPLNCVDRHYLSFIETTLPKAKEKGTAVIAMKVFAAGNLLEGEHPPVTPEECIRYTASLPVATAICGCDTVAQVDRDARAFKSFEPLSAAEKKAILRRTEPRRGRETEWYKRRT